jgi:hypothetical protein
MKGISDEAHTKANDASRSRVRSETWPLRFDCANDDRSFLGGNQRGSPMRRRRYTQHTIGKLRIRAAKILAANFPEWDVRPEDIKPVTGSYRTCSYHDVYRWELFTRKKKLTSNGGEFPVVCGCWLTLTDFVKAAAKDGCCVNRDSEIYPGKNED